VQILPGKEASKKGKQRFCAPQVSVPRPYIGLGKKKNRENGKTSTARRERLWGELSDSRFKGEDAEKVEMDDLSHTTDYAQR